VGISARQLKHLPLQAVLAEHAFAHLSAPDEPVADAVRILKVWGFRYCQLSIWRQTPRFSEFWTTDHVVVVFGVKGAKCFRDRSLASLHDTDNFCDSALHRELMRTCDGPFLHIFGRSALEDWVVLNADER
jgi:hypothetical protein